MPPWLVSETRAGEPLEWGGRLLVPFAHILGVRLPLPSRWSGAQFTWIRPVSVLVRESDGQETILPVVNITRRVIWGLYGACAALVLVAGLFSVVSGAKLALRHINN